MTTTVYTVVFNYVSPVAIIARFGTKKEAAAHILKLNRSDDNDYDIIESIGTMTAAPATTGTMAAAPVSKRSQAMQEAAAAVIAAMTSSPTHVPGETRDAQNSTDSDAESDDELSEDDTSQQLEDESAPEEETDDIDLICAQTGARRATAIEAFRANAGDISATIKALR
jgi:NACalpha-BTF3-like transcription factor